MRGGREQSNSLQRRCRDLVRLLDELTEQHTELLSAVEGQVEAMSRADGEGMRVAGQRAQSLTQRISTQEGLRRQLMDVIGMELGLVGGRGRGLTAGQLAERIAGPARQTLEAAAERLGEVIGRVARANQVSASVVGGVLGHLKEVFATITRDCSEGTSYAGDGESVAPGGMRILEAVG